MLSRSQISWQRENLRGPSTAEAALRRRATKGRDRSGTDCANSNLCVINPLAIEGGAQTKGRLRSFTEAGERWSCGCRFLIGRGEWIRTTGLYVPNVALYQTRSEEHTSELQSPQN